MRKLLLVLAVFVAWTGSDRTSMARPCRPGYPNCRRPPPPPPPPPPAPPVVTSTIYQRVDPATPAAKLDGPTLARLLVGSIWTRLGSRDQIRFVEPSADHFSRPPEQGRDRSIRGVTLDLVRDRGAWLVVLDSELYTVSACELARATGTRPAVMTTCLEHREVSGAYGGQSYGR